MKPFSTPRRTIRSRGANYAKTITRSFEIDKIPGLVTRKLDSTISLLEGTSRCDAFTEPMPIDDAFVLLVRLEDSRPYQLWIDGRFMPTGNLKAGTSSIFDLRTSPYCISVGHFRHIHFYLPRQTLNEIAETEGLGHISEISYANGFANADPVMKHLGSALESAFGAPKRVNQLFVDHVTTGVADHFLKAYGKLRFYAPRRQPTLSSRQERCAKEILSAHPDGEVKLSELAAACDMTIRGFRQAFRASTGVPPHRWLLRYRIDQALALLRGSRTSIFEVALHCGFGGEQHLTDVFLKHLGNPPEAFQEVSLSRTYLRH